MDILFMILFIIATLFISVFVKEMGAMGSTLVSIIASLSLALCVLKITKKHPDIILEAPMSNHTGYTVDTTYTIKNGVKQGVTYTVKEKKK